jgi:quinoprotein relay system zinc metallohydrolase 2
MNYFFLVFGFILSQNAGAVEALTMSQIAPGIYLHQSEQYWPDRENHGEIANIGFIVGEKCVAVIDSGGSPQQGIALKKAIKQITATPICYVINTHVHPDHIYGNLAFKQSGVQFVGHYKLPRAMAVRGEHYLSNAKQTLDIHVDQDNIVPPDLTVKDSMKLELGNREILLTAHPSAHTDNDLSVYDKTTNTFWLADILFVEHIPVLDGSIKGWLSELNRLEKFHYALVIPGHGHPVKDWPAGMLPQKAYLNKLANETRKLIRQGKTLEQAVETVGLSDRNHWELFDQFHRKNVTIAFAELEWED